MTKGQDTNRKSDGAQWLELANGGGVMLRNPSLSALPRARFARRRPARGLLPPAVPDGGTSHIRLRRNALR